MKPKLLIVELWGLGDLVIATPLLRAAAEHFDITLLAKPYALDLQRRLWPEVRVVPFIAPWTAFKNKYRLWQWPWREIVRLRRQLAAEHFDSGLSARWDPRDHLLLKLAGVRDRIGFPRVGSRIFLTRPPRAARPGGAPLRILARRGPRAGPRTAAARKNFHPRRSRPRNRSDSQRRGPARPRLAAGKLPAARRAPARKEYPACKSPATPTSGLVAARRRNAAWPRPPRVTELIALIDRAGAFIGNDSGPGHLAAFCGVPTFTLFGPQLPEWFAPLHPAAEWMGPGLSLQAVLGLLPVCRAALSLRGDGG